MGKRKPRRQTLRVLFSENLRRVRNERGLSQEELASLSSLHRTYIGSVERGERNISIDNVEKIANALNVEAIELLAYSSRGQK